MNRNEENETNTWKLNISLLNNDGVQKKVKRFWETNENENTTY